MHTYQSILALAAVVVWLYMKHEGYIGARIVDRSRYPWFVSIGKSQEKAFCGGCLVHPRVVVTAGHCISETVGQFPTTSYVWLYDKDGTRQTRRVVKVIKAYAHIKKDIGIILVDEPFDAVPIALGTNEKLTHGQDIHGIGHGRDAQGKSGVFKKTTMTYVRPESCYYGNPAETFFCTKSRRRGACKGDSGGPAFVRHSKTDYLVGLTSHGPKKCRKKDGFLYTVYTDFTDDQTLQLFLGLLGTVLLED